MRDCQVKKRAGMIKTSKAKEFEKFTADEEHYKPTGGKSIREVGF